MFVKHFIILFICLKFVNGNNYIEEKQFDESEKNKNNFKENKSLSQQSESQIIDLILKKDYRGIQAKLTETDPQLTDYKRMQRIFEHAYTNNRENFLALIYSLNSSSVRLNIWTVYWKMNKLESKHLIPLMGLNILTDVVRQGEFDQRTIKRIFRNLKETGGINRSYAIWYVVEKLKTEYQNIIGNILRFLNIFPFNESASMAKGYFVGKFYKSGNYSGFPKSIKNEIQKEFESLPLSVMRIYYLEQLYITNGDQFIRELQNGSVGLGNAYVASFPWVAHHVRKNIFQFKKLLTNTFLSISEKTPSNYALTLMSESESNATKWKVFPFKKGGVRLYNINFRVSLCRSTNRSPQLFFLKNHDKDSNFENCQWLIEE